MGPIEFAEAGLFVFPCVPGMRVPLRGLKWTEKATNDPDKVRRAMTKHPDWNWACAPGKSGHSVLDIDVKKDKDGWAALRQHGLVLPEDTFRVSTPNGGLHIYFKGVMSSRTGALLGLDIKSDGGYVLIPGSRVTDSDKPYEVIAGSLEDHFPEAPEWLHKLAGPRAEKDPNSKEPLVEWDLEHNVAIAIKYLEGAAPMAIENHAGDSATLQVALMVKDFGISPLKNLELLAEHWNDTKAVPPWRLDELETKVVNAYLYGRNAPGSKSLDVMFPTTTPMFKPWSTWDAEKRPPRKWVLNGRYMIGYVTMTVADGGVGKSSLTIAEAVAVATGRRDIVGREVMIKGPVAISNIEDPEDELQSKIDAVGLHFKVPLAERANVHAASGYGTDWRLVVKGKDPADPEAKKGVGPKAPG